MKVLGVVCSSRLKGNTEIMVQTALNSAKEAGAEIELVSVAKKNIAPCDGCFSCIKTAKCKIKDDMQDIYTKFLEADGIIIGSPVYSWTVSAQAKAIIDRMTVFQYAMARTTKNLVTHPGGSLRGKVGGAVVTARRAGCTSAMAVLFNFFNNYRLVIAGGTEGLSDPYRTLDMEGKNDKGAVRNDKVGMAQAAALGKSVVKHIKILAKD